jgi:hypothetical protein
LEGDRVSQEGFLLIRVRVEIELFASRIPIIKVEVAGMCLSLLLGERAEKWYVIQQCEQSLGNLYARPFHTCIGPGGVSDFVNSGIF